METNRIPSSYANILCDLHKELMNIPDLSENIDFSLLVALAFIFDDKRERDLKSVHIDSQYSVEDYICKARKILIARPKLSELGKLIDTVAKSSKERISSK